MYAVTENPTIRRLAFHPIMSTESLKAADVEAEAAGPWIALFIAAATMAVGAGFGYLAWSLDSFRHGAIAVVLLFAAPALAVVAMLARNVAGAPDEGTPALELMERLRRLDVSLRAVQLARAHIYVGASWGAVLGICVATYLMGSRDFVLFYAVALVIAAACYLPWTARQETRLQDQRANCRLLLGERKAARTWLIE